MNRYTAAVRHTLEDPIIVSSTAKEGNTKIITGTCSSKLAAWVKGILCAGWIISAQEHLVNLFLRKWETRLIKKETEKVNLINSFILDSHLKHRWWNAHKSLKYFTFLHPNNHFLIVFLINDLNYWWAFHLYIFVSLLIIQIINFVHEIFFPPMQPSQIQMIRSVY